MKISGKVRRVVHYNDVNNFYILSMVIDTADHIDDHLKGKTVTVKGNITGFDISTNTWLSMEGSWKTHPKYGDQFQISKCPAISDDFTVDEIKGLLTNIGLSSMFADRLAHKRSSVELLEILQDIDLLIKAMPSLNKVTATTIISNWKKRLLLIKTMRTLTDLKLSQYQITSLSAHYGDKVDLVLNQNPWKPSIDGILSFSVCDGIAIKLGKDLNSDNRLVSCILKVCSDTHTGHCYLKSGDIYAQVEKNFPMLDKKKFAQVLKELHLEEKIYIDKGVHSFNKGKVTAIYSKKSFLHESESARLLAERNNQVVTYEELLSFSQISPDVEDYINEHLISSSYNKLDKAEKIEVAKDIADKVVESWSKTAQISLSDLQYDGVINGLTSPVSVITGLPGTGKTTSLRALVSIYRQIGITPTLLAPTGIAAKRLEGVTGSKAYTVHKALGSKLDRGEEDDKSSTYEGVTKSLNVKNVFDRDNTEWEYDEDNPHPAKVIIIDESSMLDQSILYKVMTATNNRCKLVFVGDSAQLPSVGAGDVLRSLENSQIFPTVSLTEIYRQASQSDIVLASHSIHKGVVPNLKGYQDFILEECQSEDEILEKIIDVAVISYSNRNNFQILSPRHKGTVGVTNLNVRLREVINPKMSGVNQLKLFDTYVREGDRIMVVKNDYDKNIFNGDVGKISSIDLKKQQVTIKIHSYGNAPASLVMIPVSEVGEYLRLAYAVTVHKSQGQEYDYIFMPITDSFSIQLVRNLLYTSVTRAKKKVILYGTRTAFEKAISNNTEDTRNTLLMERIVSNAIPF